MSRHWYYLKVDQRKGPLAGEELQELAASGQLQPADLVSRSGMAAWVQAGLVPGLGFGSAPGPAAPPPPVHQPLPIQPGDPLDADHFPLAAGQQIDYWYTRLPADPLEPRMHLFEREEWHAPGHARVRIGTSLIETDGHFQRPLGEPLADLLPTDFLHVHRRLHAGFLEEKWETLEPAAAAFEPLLKLGATPGDHWEFTGPNATRSVFLYLGHHPYHGQPAAVVECTEHSHRDHPWIIRRYYQPGKGLVHQEWHLQARLRAKRSRIDPHRNRLPG